MGRLADVWLVYLLGGGGHRRAGTAESEGLAIEKVWVGGRQGRVLLPHLRIFIVIIFEQSSLDAYLMS